MGSIKRNFANNLSTGGVVLKSIINNDSMDNVTSFPSGIPADSITLISSQTASASASISFTTGINSTYKAYKFVFSNIHPATDTADFTFNMSTDGGSNYNVTKTTTFFRANHLEDDAFTQLAYDTAHDLAQGTGFQTLAKDAGSDNDENSSGSLTLFNPSSTTYVKHFIATISSSNEYPAESTQFIAGYGNTTSAVNAVQFKFDTGNIDAGTIYLYGIK